MVIVGLAVASASFCDTRLWALHTSCCSRGYKSWTNRTDNRTWNRGHAELFYIPQRMHYTCACAHEVYCIWSNLALRLCAESARCYPIRLKNVGHLGRDGPGVARTEPVASLRLLVSPGAVTDGVTFFTSKSDDLFQSSSPLPYTLSTFPDNRSSSLPVNSATKY